MLKAIERHRRLILTAYTVGLLVLTLAPLPGGPAQPPAIADKLGHLLLFGGLVLVFFGNFEGPRRAPALVASFVGSVSLAALVELLQGLLPYRSEDVWDLVAGAVGALLAALLLGALKRRSR